MLFVGALVVNGALDVRLVALVGTRGWRVDVIQLLEMVAFKLLLLFAVGETVVVLRRRILRVTSAPIIADLVVVRIPGRFVVVVVFFAVVGMFGLGFFVVVVVLRLLVDGRWVVVPLLTTAKMVVTGAGGCCVTGGASVVKLAPLS